MSDFTVHEAGDLIPKKKKKKTGDSKKKKSSDKPVKKKKKSPEPSPTKRTRAALLGEPEKIKVKTKKKKKKTVNEEEISTLPSTDVASQSAQTNELTTEFDNLYGKHLDQLAVEDREQMEEYFIMFRKLQKIARRFEEKSILGSSKDVYALMKVYDQMREIIADLKALKDVSELADRMQGDILQPFARVTIQELSGLRSNVIKTATRMLPSDKIEEFNAELDSYIVMASQNLETGYESARDAIVAIYSED